MDQENIMFFKNQDKSYTMVDLYLNNRFFGYKDSYNYYDIDVDKILLFKKSDNEYIIRYNDVNKMKIVPLQLKINNVFGKIPIYTKNNRVMPIDNDDEEPFRKCREIWNKITELMGINKAKDFVETTLDDGDEFIMADVHENTSFVGDSNISKFVIVLLSFIDDYLQTLLVQHINTHRCTKIHLNTPMNHINNHKEKYIITARIP